MSVIGEEVRSPGVSAHDQVMSPDRVLARAGDDFAARERHYGRMVLAGRIAVVLAVVGLWEWASGRWIDTFFIAKPSTIAAAFYGLLVHDNLLYHLQFTVLEAVLGYIIGAAAGIVCGYVLARSDVVYAIAQPILSAFYGIPRIALAPLIIMWLGIGLNSKIVVAAMMVFFIVFMNTIAGIRSVNPEFIHIARVMGATERQIIHKVVLPAAAPVLITGLQTSVPQAMIGAIVGEFISSNRGVGHLINRAAGWFDTPGLFAGIFALLVIVLLMNYLVALLDARATRWKGGSAANHL